MNYIGCGACVEVILSSSFFVTTVSTVCLLVAQPEPGWHLTGDVHCSDTHKSEIRLTSDSVND